MRVSTPSSKTWPSATTIIETVIRQTTANINLDNICHNTRVARQASSGGHLMAVVKADAYGHGAVPVAKAISELVDAFAVGRLSEAAELRRAGITRPVCLLEGFLDEYEMQMAAELNLQLVVHTPEQLALLNQAAPAQVWIKIDTGMGRLGFHPEALSAVLESLDNHKLLGLMTHLSSADEPDSSPTLDQLKQLEQVASNFTLNVGNSAGIVNQQLTAPNITWSRPGVMLYGGSPLAAPEALPALKAGMTLVAPVIAVREISSGSSVGYGRTWRATEDCRIAVVAAGYADGYPREIRAGTCVLTGNGLREVVGRVSMDMITVLLRSDDEISIGDAITLWGEGLAIEHIAAAADTIPYTLMTGVTRRVVRHYG